MKTPTIPIILPPDSTDSFDFAGLGVDWKIHGSSTSGQFSVVHHPLAPRALAAPLHLHHREDEYSFVLKGKLGALLGEDVVRQGRALGSSNRAGNGTPSGMRVMLPVKSSKSFLPLASNSTSARWPPHGAMSQHSPPSTKSTPLKCASTACPTFAAGFF